MPSTPTIRDVARRAGVGTATVSRVFNNHPAVKPETRERVLRAAAELGYVPAASARALASGRTHTIGLLLSRSPHHIATDAFLTRLVEELILALRAQHLRLLLDIVEEQENQQAYLDLAQSKRIDGLILSGPRLNDPALHHLVESGFPTVVMGWVPNEAFYCVDIDNRAAARKAVAHLLSLGRRRIACITNAPPDYLAAQERLQGYRDALQAHGLPYQDALVRFGDFDIESGYLQMRSLLRELTPPPDAVFVASDVVAFGALAALREHGFRVPEDIALVSFDDVPLAQYVDPPLTTVHLPVDQLAQQAVAMLVACMQGKIPPQNPVLLDTYLVIRASCGAQSA